MVFIDVSLLGSGTYVFSTLSLLPLKGVRCLSLFSFMKQLTVQEPKRRNKPVEFIPGMKLKFCGNCGSTKVVETETEIKCPDCGMGKLKGGR
ncbi:MAG: hypothetical protein ABSE15_00605 [Candidatus Bathyarchaeia archaeon]|jgi:NADH pyrophosphatase NudC (nudix superfamily)